jgi:hypothetical protein
MPSLFRFLVIVGVLVSVVYGGLYILATRYEPDQQEEKKVVPGVKIIRK